MQSVDDRKLPTGLAMKSQDRAFTPISEQGVCLPFPLGPDSKQATQIWCLSWKQKTLSPWRELVYHLFLGKGIPRPLWSICSPYELFPHPVPKGSFWNCSHSTEEWMVYLSVILHQTCKNRRRIHPGLERSYCFLSFQPKFPKKF